MPTGTATAVAIGSVGAGPQGGSHDVVCVAWLTFMFCKLPRLARGDRPKQQGGT